MKKRSYSLMWVLFVAMILMSTMIYLFIQFRDAGQFGLTPPDGVETLSITNLIAEYRHAVMLIVITSVTLWLALHFTLKPMRRLSEQAGAIGPANLNERLPLDKAPTEIAPLVSAFNLSLDRLEAAWATQRAFSANAAHELRTPLATLRAHVESLLPAGERGVATAEFDRLARLIEQLLFLAEADQDHLKTDARFDLVALARDTAMEMAPRILTQGREISFDSAVDAHACHGDPILAGIAIRNLIENAARHTPAGAHIDISIDAAGMVTVRDDGPGIPEAFESRLFERFAKSQATAGAGLGLSIVARIMTLHSGQVSYERLSPGSAFHLTFPATIN